MKELNDEDLQRMLEEGNLPGKDNLPPTQKDDLEAYHLLFSELKRPPEVHLPYNFAANVAAAVRSKKHRLSILFFYLLAIGVAIAGITGSYILLLMLNQPFALHLSAIILPYKWLIIFGILSLLLIQYTDQKLVKEPKGMV